MRWLCSLLAAALIAVATPAAPRASEPGNRAARIAQLAFELRQGSPWPALREERIRTLLPKAMDEAGVDAWVVLCRENNNDPLAKHVGGENAGRLTGFVFLRTGTAVTTVVFAGETEVISMRESLPFARVVTSGADGTVFELIAGELRHAGSMAIAINKSALASADGLTATQYEALLAALGPDLSGRLRSSQELVTRWLSVKLPAEIEIMRKAAVLTDLLEYEAFDPIVPGKTTNGDMQRQMRARVEQLGFGHAWTDDPGITSGLDRGRGSDATRVIIPGDVINIDFGIKVYDTWCTDIQRFAYVLEPDETTIPPAIAYAWESASQSSRKMRAAMHPGAFGWEIDKVQVDWMDERGSLKHPFGTGHSVGYWAHDVGPSIGGYRKGATPVGNGARKLEPGMIFAFDGNYVWAATDGADKGTQSITSEEMAVVTATGAEYLSPVQEKLVVIPSRRSLR